MIIKKLEELTGPDLEGLLSRDIGIQEVLPEVNEILMEVGSKGDRALFSLTEKFEKVKLEFLSVGQEEIVSAYDAVDQNLLDALEKAAENITAFHYAQKERDLWLNEISPGVVVGQKIAPLDSL